MATVNHPARVRWTMEESVAYLGLQGTIAPEALLVLVTFQSVIFNPLALGLLLAFGEVYGWRGFLQGKLIKLGKVKGIALLGLIWGIWHAPVILMGYNYPGRPVADVIMMIAYSPLLACVLGYTVLKTGNVLLAAFLRGVNNSAIQFATLMFVQPNDPILCFGAGVFGLACWLLVVVLILRGRSSARKVG